jgi:hypothetical protein
MKKVLIITSIILGVIIVGVIVFSIQTRMMINRGELVKWEGQWYTQEEFRQMYPPEGTEVPAKNTPEEVYETFRQALLDDDIDTALLQIREEKKEQYQVAFLDKQKLENWTRTLPATIEEERIDGNFAYYDIDYGTEYKNSVTFIKNQKGYWQIDTI